MELTRITPRYGARIHDLRRAGFTIRTDQDRASGVTRYTLLFPAQESEA